MKATLSSFHLVSSKNRLVTRNEIALVRIMIGSAEILFFYSIKLILSEMLIFLTCLRFVGNQFNAAFLESLNTIPAICSFKYFNSSALPIDPYRNDTTSLYLAPVNQNPKVEPYRLKLSTHARCFHACQYTFIHFSLQPKETAGEIPNVTFKLKLNRGWPFVTCSVFGVNADTASMTTIIDCWPLEDVCQYLLPPKHVVSGRRIVQKIVRSNIPKVRVSDESMPTMPPVAN